MFCFCLKPLILKANTHLPREVCVEQGRPIISIEGRENTGKISNSSNNNNNKTIDIFIVHLVSVKPSVCPVMLSSLLECEISYIIPILYKRTLKFRCSKKCYRNYKNTKNKDPSLSLWLHLLLWFSSLQLTPSRTTSFLLYSLNSSQACLPDGHWIYYPLIWHTVLFLSPWPRYPNDWLPHHLPPICSNVVFTERTFVHFPPQFAKPALFFSIAIFTFSDNSLPMFLHPVLLSKLSWIKAVVCC